jgi:hypothetical protein
MKRKFIDAECHPAPEALFWDAPEKCPKERTPRKILFALLGRSG